MAYFEDNRFEEEQYRAPQDAEAPGASGGQSVASVQSPGGKAPAGAGGTGGWTNIQSYLNANKADTGSAQALNKTVGDQFNQERQNVQNESDQFLNDAYKQVEDSSISTGQAQDLLNSASSQYSWGNTQPVEYQDKVSKVQNALTTQYGGPREYNYGFSDKTQEYGTALGDQGGFDKLMSDVYSKSAGSPMSPGAINLQKQLDVSSDALANTRQNLKGQFGQLEANRDSVVADTTSKLGDVEKQYRSNQSALKDWLYGQSTSNQQKIDQLEADARAGYNQSYRNDRTGQMNAVQRSGVAADPDWYAARNVWGENLTPEQLQNERNLYNTPGRAGERGSYYYIDNVPNDRPAWQTLRSAYSENQNFLDNWYGQQDAKYANTADQEERNWNTIQDFLGLDGPRKQQGFKVRG